MNDFTNILISMEEPLLQTIYMVSLSTIFSLIIGAPLGIILTITDKGHIMENPILNRFLGTIVNIFRSIPFIILIVALFPLSKLIVGKTIGTNAAIVSLSVAASPFVARIIESSLKELPFGIIEAALASGATTSQIIFKVMLPEAAPSLVLGITITIINILGYSAMAGAVGGQGIGDFAIREGYLRYNNKVIWITILILVIFVEIIQNLGQIISKKLDKR